jgi:hypothetical protein
MDSIGRCRVARFSWVVLSFVALAFGGTASEAQQQRDAERAYFGAVARYFQMPEGEVAILASWELPAEEIPVLLFVARRAGVSAEALVALREAGSTWTDLSDRYQIGARALHVPIRDPSAAGRLDELYATFGETPVDRWEEINLSSEHIVALVNVRVLSQSLGLTPDEVMRLTAREGSFVDLYVELVR